MPKPVRRSNRRKLADPVKITTDAFTGRPIAHCSRCAESATADAETWVTAWADSHTCDPEMAALLALLDGNGQAA